MMPWDLEVMCVMETNRARRDPEPKEDWWGVDASFRRAVSHTKVARKNAGFLGDVRRVAL